MASSLPAAVEPEASPVPGRYGKRTFWFTGFLPSYARIRLDLGGLFQVPRLSTRLQVFFKPSY